MIFIITNSDKQTRQNIINLVGPKFSWLSNIRMKGTRSQKLIVVDVSAGLRPLFPIYFETIPC